MNKLTDGQIKILRNALVEAFLEGYKKGLAKGDTYITPNRLLKKVVQELEKSQLRGDLEERR